MQFIISILVERMTPESSVMMVNWIDIWLHNIENFLQKELTNNHSSHFIQQNLTLSATSKPTIKFDSGKKS